MNRAQLSTSAALGWCRQIFPDNGAIGGMLRYADPRCRNWLVSGSTTSKVFGLFLINNRTPAISSSPMTSWSLRLTPARRLDGSSKLDGMRYLCTTTSDAADSEIWSDGYPRTGFQPDLLIWKAMGEKRGKTAHLGRPQQQMNQSGDLFLGVHWSKQVRRKGRFRGLESDLGLGLEGGVGRCSPGVTYFSFLSCDTGSESYSFGIRHRERLTCRLFPIRNLRWWAGERRERAGGARGCGHCGAAGSSSDGMTACGYDGHFGGSPSHEDVLLRRNMGEGWSPQLCLRGS